MSQLKVLVIDEAVPLPLNNGKKIRTFNLLSELGARHEITFLSFGREDEAAALRTHGIRSRVMAPLSALTGVRLLADVATSLITPYPYSVVKHHQKRMQVAITEALQTHYDLVQIEWTPYARYKIDGFKSVLSTHNIETDIWNRRSEYGRSAIAKVFFADQARRMRRFEQRAFERADMVTTVSEDDERRAREWGARHTRIVPNGVDPGYFHVDGTTERDPRRFVFLGSLDWFPNEDAIRDLIERVLPLVRSDITLEVVGRNPSSSLRSLISAAKRVKLHADVSDVRPFLSRAGGMLVPLRIGGGSRIKILEALASQLPVISTTVGAEGLGLESDREIVIADAPEQIAAAIDRSVKDPAHMKQLATAGHQKVLKNYTWRQSAERLEGAWFEVAGR